MHRRFFALLIVAAACSTAVVDTPTTSESASAAAGAPQPAEAPNDVITDVESPVAESFATCDTTGEPVAWNPTEWVELAPLLAEDGITVHAAVYPRPDYDGKPWSQWGQGAATDDGRFFSAIGDHHGADGNSYLYEYNPTTRRLTRFADVNEIVGQVSGSWGFGKVHAQMVAGPCGIYAATYWGTRRGLAFDDDYQGDHLLVIDPEAETVTDLSVILPEHGVPSLASDPTRGLIYAEAVDPFITPNTGSFLVLDQAGEEVFRTDAPHTGFRTVAVDAEGRAYFSTGDTALTRFDPDTHELTLLSDELPGSLLRAVTPPAPDGTIFGVTKNPPVFFSLTPDGTITELAPARGYTTTLVLDPSGDTMYYVPHAHGGAYRAGAPIVSVDTSTGEEEVLVLLNGAAETHLNLTLGGTYSLAIDPAGTTLYLGMNAGEVGSGSTFGEVVLFVIELDA